MKINVPLLKTIDKNKTYILACSFGPDSMTLFDLLRKEGFNFVCCHTNYHHRPEADMEELRLRAYCDQHNISFYLHNAFYQDAKENFQTWARKERYQFFKKIYDQIAAAGLFVAHQQDDCIETYLMQKYHKKMVAYYGISPVTTILGMNVYRPLLDMSKQQTYDYCELNDIPHTIDSSNLSDEYERNRLRHHEVEPMSKKERADILKEVAMLNKKTSELKEEMDELLGDYNILNVKDLMHLNDEQLRYVIYRFYARKIEPSSFKGEYVKEVKKMIDSKKPNIKTKIAHELYIIKEYETIRIYDLEEILNYSYFVTTPSVLKTPHFILDLLSNQAKKLINLSDYPLEIRNAKSGDKYKIKNYVTKVRRLYIDWKMPTYYRKRWPVIVNNKDEIIYIPRYRSDYTSKEGEMFKIN